MTNKHISDIATAAIHGLQPHIAEHAHNIPIFASTSFTFDSAEQGMKRFAGKEKGFIYSRFSNPTTQAAADIIAQLETFGIKEQAGGPMQAAALLTASGQSAMSTLFLTILSAGDSILASQALYGGTYEFLNRFIQRFGIKCHFIDMGDLNAVEEAVKNDPSIKLLHLETPANPIMQCIDIEGICTIARQYGKLVSVDNTFATPYLQQPFRYGVDYIFHSTTKFLNGHGNAIGGAIIGRDIEFMRTKMYSAYKLLGCNSNPFDAFQLIQGIKTLGVRMDKHCSNAEQVAAYLSKHEAVDVVHYHGLQEHPGFAIAKKQMKHAGGVLSFELKGDLNRAIQFINKLKICVRAVSLGTTDTLISHPASMSHAGMSKEQRIEAGISDGLIRMSVGLEDIGDLLNDLEQALA